MTRGRVDQPGRWALPPQPPETWVSNAAVLTLVLGAAGGVAVPSLVLVRDAGLTSAVVATLYALGALLSVASSYLLVVQAAVTQDRRLGWAAGGFATLWLLYLLRSYSPAFPGSITDPTDLRGAAALSFAWLLVLPVTALTAALRRLSLGLLVVPLLITAGLGWMAYTLPLVQTDGTRLAGSGRTLMLVAGALGIGAALWWRHRVPYGNVRSWGWVGALLLLTPVVAVLRAATPRSASWAALAVEDVLLAVPALGLYVESWRGYFRQSRRWHQLEGEVRQLSASSALLPGLSITPENEAGLPERLAVVELLEQAAMQVALQPVLDLATGTPVGQEALARFGGRVPTDRWFRAAGLHGLGLELERITLARALLTLETLPAGQFLAINTSPSSLHDEAVRRLLQAYDLSRVIIEITEHDAVNDYAVTRDVLRELRDAGARIAVDDVGAGFASLHHVLLLQPEVVKLDTSLTRDVHDNPRQLAIVQALVTFADEVGAVVLAEGIEVAEQVPALIDAGVTLGQGWHLGIPVIGT